MYIYSDTIEAIHLEIGFRAGMRLAAQLAACPRLSKVCEDGVARMEEREFRDRLRRLIEEKGLSARKMSRRLGRNDSYIQNILSGGALPSMPDVSENLRLSPHNAGDVLERRRGCGRRSGAKAAQAGRAAARGFVGAR